MIFAAKSSEDRRDAIPHQLDKCRALADRDGLDVVAEYHDEAESAYSKSRGLGLRDAMALAERLVAERGACTLIVDHSDRLARGDGKHARHLVEYALWALKTDVTITSVQDPLTFADIGKAGDMGQRNYEDSRRKGEAVRDGLERAARRGAWRGGIRPDGYRVIRDVDERGKVTARLELDPDRAGIYRLLWDLARAGYSAQAITLELDRRGYRTAPVKRTHRPRPFDSNRVRQTLDNPVYAGLVVHRGEVIGPGDWPAYVTPEDFHRLREERRLRMGADRRGPGRPAGPGYVLARLARCGECGGPMDCVTVRYVRLDGTRKRTYVCRSHREHPRGHQSRCPAPPLDAALVDGAVVVNLDRLIGDIDGARSQLAAARREERARLEREAARAREDVAESDRVAARARAKADACLAAGEDEKADAALAVLAERLAERSRAETRLTAALDALSAPEPRDDDGEEAAFDSRLSEALQGRLDGARDDVKRVNAALIDFLAWVKLTAAAAGTVRIEPQLSPAAALRILRDAGRWTERVALDLDGGGTGRVLGAGPEPGTVLLELGDPEGFERLPDGSVRIPAGRGAIPAPGPIEASAENPRSAS